VRFNNDYKSLFVCWQTVKLILIKLKEKIEAAGHLHRKIHHFLHHPSSSVVIGSRAVVVVVVV